MKAYGLSIAILIIECPEILEIHYNDVDVQAIFTMDVKCIPEHIRNLKGNYLKLQYLDALTELMENKLEVKNQQILDIPRQNIRTSVLSHIKKIFSS